MTSNNISKIFPVEIVDSVSGKSRLFYLYQGLTNDEFKELFTASFDDLKGATVGFRDASGIYYPFSLLMKNVKLFEGQQLFIISEKSNTTGATQPLTIINGTERSIMGTKQVLNEDDEDDGGEDDEDELTEQHAMLVFRLLDKNNDDQIHKEEFIEMLTPSYQNLLDRHPGLAFAYSTLTSRELAIATAVSCYSSLETGNGISSSTTNSGDGYYLSFDEFAAWYLSSGRDFLQSFMIEAMQQLFYEYTTGTLTNNNNTTASSMSRNKSRPILQLKGCYQEAQWLSFVALSRRLISFPKASAFTKFLTATSSTGPSAAGSGDKRSTREQALHSNSGQQQLHHRHHLVTREELERFMIESCLQGNVILSMEHQEDVQEIVERWLATVWQILWYSTAAGSEEVDEDDDEEEQVDEEDKKRVHVGRLLLFLFFVTYDQPGAAEPSADALAVIFQAYQATTSSPSSQAVQYANEAMLYDFMILLTTILFYFCPAYSSTTGVPHPVYLAHAITLKVLLSVETERSKPKYLTKLEMMILSMHAMKLLLVETLQIEEEKAVVDGGSKKTKQANYFYGLLAWIYRMVGKEQQQAAVTAVAANGSRGASNTMNGRVTSPVQQTTSSMMSNAATSSASTLAAMNGYLMPTSPSMDSLVDEDDQVISYYVGYHGSPVTIAVGREVLGLYEYTTADVMKYIMQLADEKGNIDQVTFSRGILKLIGEHYIALTVLQRSLVDFILDRISMTFDPILPDHLVQQLGKYDMLDICIALLLFCEDDEEDDDDQEGNEDSSASTYRRSEVILALIKPQRLKFSVVRAIVRVLFKMAYSLNPAIVPEEYLPQAEQEADAFVIAYYLQYVAPKANNSNTVAAEGERMYHTIFTQQQFLLCLEDLFAYVEQESSQQLQAQQQQQNSNKATGSSVADKQSGEKMSLQTFSGDDQDGDDMSNQLRFFRQDEKYPPNSVVLELRAASSILGLENYRADNLLDKLGNECQLGKLDARGWAKWVATVLKAAEVSEQDIDLAMYLGHKIFAVFQHDEHGLVKFSHLVAGLAFLCGQSSIEERIMVAFTVMDEDSDGLLSFADFCTCLHSVFSILQVCSKMIATKITALGGEVTLAELTRATALQGIQALGVMEEEELSLEMVMDMAEDYVKLASLI